MTGPAVLLMLLTILIVWGGLAASTTALVLRAKRESVASATLAARHSTQDKTQ